MVERSALDQQAADGPQVQFPAGRLQKVVLSLIHRVAAVGKLFTIIALAGVEAVHEGYMAVVRYGADL